MKKIISLALLLTMLFGAMFSVMPAAADGTLVVKGAQVEFGTTVYLNVAVDASGVAGADASNVKLQVTAKDGTVTVLDADDAITAELGAGFVGFKYTELGAKNMGDVLSLQALYNDAANGAAVKFSILQYTLFAKDNDPTNTKLADLLDAMLLFGAAAQDAFLPAGETVATAYDYDLDHAAGYCYIKVDDSFENRRITNKETGAIDTDIIYPLREGTVWPMDKNNFYLSTGDFNVHIYDQYFVYRGRANNNDLFNTANVGHIRKGEVLTLYMLPKMQGAGAYSADNGRFSALDVNPRPANNGAPDVSMRTTDWEADDHAVVSAAMASEKKFTISYAVTSLPGKSGDITLQSKGYANTNSYSVGTVLTAKQSAGGTICLLSNYLYGGVVTPVVRPVHKPDHSALISGAAYSYDTDDINGVPLEGGKANYGAYTLIHIVFDCTDAGAMKLVYYVGSNTTPVYEIQTSIPATFFTTAANGGNDLVTTFYSYGGLGIMSARVTAGNITENKSYEKFFN